ncbi:MAG: lysophospholipid acyltransferase family protein [Myxococcaceae bacterium]
MAPSLSKRLKRTLRYGLLRAALAVLGRLPLGWAQALGRAVGTAAFHLAPGERAKALASLSVAFPEMSEEARLELARRCFRHLGTAVMEMVVAPRLGDRFDALVDCSGDALAAMERAAASGKGGVCVAAHLGNWELHAWGVARHGLPLHAVGKENVDPRLTRLIDRFRARGGVRNVWRGQPGAAVALLRALRKGQLLGLLIDQDTNVQNVFVPFFGRPAATPRAAADLVLRTGAAALVCLIHKREDGTYRASSEEVEVPHTGDPERDVVELTARFTARIEAAIRAHPEQWVWMHQRWKTKAC